MSIFSIAKRATLVVAMAAALGACASSQIGGGNTVSRDATRGASAVEYGVVIDSRQVTIEGTRSGVGAATGAVAGGIAGSQIGGGTEERAIAGVVGAVGGAVIGDAIEEGVTSQKGLQYTVRLDRGGDIVVTQGADPMIPRNARVQVIYDRDGTVRIVQVR
ncbi:MAG: glycine zipper 2TM domain-containing protein [Alphaproteobacteria bacterium]